MVAYLEWLQTALSHSQAKPSYVKLLEPPKPITQLGSAAEWLDFDG